MVEHRSTFARPSAAKTRRTAGRWPVLAALTAIACVIAWPGGQVRAQPLEPLKVRLDWMPWGVHAPFHLAQSKGWFRRAGLDVSIDDGNGSVTTIQIVGGGQYDVGHAALAPMMIARDKGLPVKAVAVFARLSDVGMLVPRDSGIKGPRNLKGKRIAYTEGSLETPFIDAFLAAGGLNRGDVELVPVEAAAKAGTYAAGRVDAAFSTIPFFLPLVSHTRPSNGVRFADFGLNMPSFGLFASEEKLKSRRDAIARFASIVAASWRYIFDGHQDEAVQAIVAQRPQARLDPNDLRDQIDSLQDYLSSRNARGQPIGVMVTADWIEAQRTLTSVDMLQRKLSVKDFFEPEMVRPDWASGIVGR